MNILRLLAHFSQDKDLINAYLNNQDLYATAASKIFNKDYWECMEHWEDGSANPEGKKLRSMVKNIILGILYGRGPASVAEKTGQTLEQAKETIDNFYNAYPTVKKWMDESIQMAHEKGYVTTISGRRRRLPNIQLPPYTIKKVETQVTNTSPLFDVVNENIENNDLVTYYKDKLDNCKNRFQMKTIIDAASKDGIEIEDNTGWIATATRQCVNARIQGSAASLSKLAMIDIYNNKELRDLGFKTLYVIHDEIAGQCPKENANKVAELLKKVMIDSATKICSVPMKVDCYIINHWYFDDLSDVIKERYDKLIKEGKTEIEAFNIIDKENPEIAINTLQKICNGTIDLINDDLAR